VIGGQLRHRLETARLARAQGAGIILTAATRTACTALALRSGPASPPSTPPTSTGSGGSSTRCPRHRPPAGHRPSSVLRAAGRVRGSLGRRAVGPAGRRPSSHRGAAVADEHSGTWSQRALVGAFYSQRRPRTLPPRSLWQVQPGGSDGCAPASSARDTAPELVHVGLAPAGVCYLAGLATGQVWTGSPVLAQWR